MKKGLVIIPAYNESGNIEKTVHDIEQNAPSFDYVVINDCSKDNTREICERNHFSLINLPVNLGIGGGVQTGYLYARQMGYSYAVQFDGDGQHNAMFLETMLQEMEQTDTDMLIGSRFLENKGFQSSALRRVGIRFFTYLIRLLTGVTITDPTSGMRMINRELIDFFAEHYPQDYPEPESVVTILKKGKHVREIPVLMNEREEGVSSISAFKSVYYMIKVTLAIFITAIKSK